MTLRFEPQSSSAWNAHGAQPSDDRGARVALVTGVGGPAGHAVCTYLRERGFSVVGGDVRPLAEEHRLRLLPPARHAGYAQALEIVATEEHARLLVPTVTEELPSVAARRHAFLQRGCALFISNPWAANIVNDKWVTSRTLAAAGVAVPCSYGGTSPSELLDSLALPILAKPRRGRGGRGVVVYQRAEDVPQNLSADSVYQEFLPGEEYDVNVFARAPGLVEAMVVLRKTALKEGVVGNAVSVERATAPDVVSLASRAVHALGLEGPLDLDIRRAADGRPAVLEINGRFGAHARAAEEVLDALVGAWGASA